MKAKNTLKKDSHTIIRDCSFLSLVVLLSFIVYLQKLGFYSDDWGYIAYYKTSNDQSLLGLFHTLSGSANIKSRPAQALYQALLYWLFTSHPFGYHLVNAFVLLSGIILFYLVLHELHQGRLLALTVPLVYALLPHYSTDRFWYSAFMVSLSMPLYFLSLYADLTVLQTRGISAWGWKLVSILSLLGSTLSYEVFLPFFLFNPLLIWYRARQLYGSIQSKHLIQSQWIILFGSNLFIWILVLIFKALTASRMSKLEPVSQSVWFSKLIAKAFIVSYGDYGLALPSLTLKLIHQYPNLLVIVLAGILSLIVFGYVYLVTNQSKDEMITRVSSLKLLGWSLVIFGMGYAIFFTNRNALITPTGINNRINIAAAVGVALSIVALIVWLSAFFPSAQLRRRCLCILIALFCTSGFIVNNTIASFWIDAYRQQQEILADIRQQFPTLPAESTLILDGICPYAGPAVVFESSWDLAGALIFFYGKRNLYADVVTPNLKIEEDGLASIMYGGANYTHHPYSEKLFVYHIDSKKIHYLTDAQTARQYFKTSNSDFNNDCPSGREGYGVKIF